MRQELHTWQSVRLPDFDVKLICRRNMEFSSMVEDAARIVIAKAVRRSTENWWVRDSRSSALTSYRNHEDQGDLVEELSRGGDSE